VISVKQTSSALLCVNCNYEGCRSRDDLLSHMRTCLLHDHPQAPTSTATTSARTPSKGSAAPPSACPWCAKPTQQLSKHLLGCKQHKLMQEKRKLQGAAGGLPGSGMNSGTSLHSRTSVF
jgi:hypothetical protein